MINDKPLNSMIRHIITEIHGIPATESEIDSVTGHIRPLLAGIAELKKLDLGNVETAGVLQIEE